jgi:ABC-2 type transport system ATP-binding protein
MSSVPAVFAQQLGYRYCRAATGARALDELSFSVAPGEIFGLLGPNGAGKTTAVRILSTILRPQSGRAAICGHDVARDPLGARRQLAVVLQENAVETMLTVRDNLRLYGRLHGQDARATTEAMARVVEMLELGPQLDKRAQELSGGTKRRLQVAKVLMVDTPVLFLDEATTGMDPLIKRTVIAAIRAEAARGRTILLTTQLLDEAESLCDRMAIMRGGKAVAAGTLDELRGLIQQRFHVSLAFAADSPAARAAVRALLPHALTELDGRFELVLHGTENQVVQALARISENWPLAGLEIRAAGLEEIFFELFGDAAPAQTAAGGAPS